jgi:hypothetical protein
MGYNDWNESKEIGYEANRGRSGSIAPGGSGYMPGPQMSYSRHEGAMSPFATTGRRRAAEVHNNHQRNQQFYQRGAPPPTMSGSVHELRSAAPGVGMSGSVHELRGAGPGMSGSVHELHHHHQQQQQHQQHMNQYNAMQQVRQAILYWFLSQIINI